MTPVPSGACCVCGKETTQQCGACGKAGFSLFFCSTEHQKLVWSSHKEVCGPKAKPFHFPPLSQKDAEFAHTPLNTPYMLTGGRYLTIAHGLVNTRSYHDPELMKYTLEGLLDSVKADQPASSSFSFDQRNELICFVCTAVCQIRLGSIPGVHKLERVTSRPEDIPLEVMQPVPYAIMAASLVGQYLSEMGLDPHPAAQDWFIDFMHHAVVLGAVAYLRHLELLREPLAPIFLSAESRIPELDRYTSISRQQLRQIADGMSAVESAQKDVVVRVLDQLEKSRPMSPF
ncbi:hypothetical protein JCM8097_000093 [Rhodosporidiobolus ruineniae]